MHKLVWKVIDDSMQFRELLYSYILYKKAFELGYAVML
jgi:hypothetical protein